MSEQLETELTRTLRSLPTYAVLCGVTSSPQKQKKSTARVIACGLIRLIL